MISCNIPQGEGYVASWLNAAFDEAVEAQFERIVESRTAEFSTFRSVLTTGETVGLSFATRMERPGTNGELDHRSTLLRTHSHQMPSLLAALTSEERRSVFVEALQGAIAFFTQTTLSVHTGPPSSRVVFVLPGAVSRLLSPIDPDPLVSAANIMGHRGASFFGSYGVTSAVLRNERYGVCAGIIEDRMPGEFDTLCNLHIRFGVFYEPVPEIVTATTALLQYRDAVSKLC